MRRFREIADMMHDIFDKSVLIFGCGNILFGDDGFGPAVVIEYLQHYLLPPEVGIMDVGTSIRDILFNLALSEKRPRQLIIVDAVDKSGKQPGEVFEISVEEIPAQKDGGFFSAPVSHRQYSQGIAGLYQHGCLHSGGAG